MKSCCAEQFEEGIKEGGKRTFIALAKSIDNLMDRMNDLRILAAECFEYLAKEEALEPSVIRLALLEKLRLKIKPKEGQKHG